MRRSFSLIYPLAWVSYGYPRKRPRLIKLDSLDAPRTVNDAVEERAAEIRNVASKQRNSKRPDSLFGKSINAKKSSFKNINSE